MLESLTTYILTSFTTSNITFTFNITFKFTFLLQKEYGVEDLHKEDSYSYVGLEECGMSLATSSEPTRMKHPC